MRRPLTFRQRWRNRKWGRPLDGFAFIAGTEKPINHIYLKRGYFAFNDGSSFAWWLPSICIDVRNGRRFFYLAIPTAKAGKRYRRFVKTWQKP